MILLCFEALPLKKKIKWRNNKTQSILLSRIEEHFQVIIIIITIINIIIITIITA